MTTCKHTQQQVTIADKTVRRQSCLQCGMETAKWDVKRKTMISDQAREIKARSAY